MLTATPNLVVTISPKRKANAPEMRTEKASQKFDPRRFIATKSDTKVKCMDKYPSLGFRRALLNTRRMSRRQWPMI